MSVYETRKAAIIQNLAPEYMSETMADSVAADILMSLGLQHDEVWLEHRMIRLRVHIPDECQGQICSVHNRSNHHMRDMPQNWFQETGIMLRICPHDVEHPDPDDIAYFRRTMNPNVAKAKSIHECCLEGCCVPVPPNGSFQRKGEQND